MECHAHIFSTPQRIEAPELHGVGLTRLGKEALVVCEPGDAEGMAFMNPETLVLATRSLSRCVLPYAHLLKIIRVRSSSLRELDIQSPTSLSSVSIDAPLLHRLKIEKAVWLQQFALQSFVMPFLHVAQNLIYGAVAPPRRGAYTESSALNLLDVYCPVFVPLHSQTALPCLPC